MQMQTFEEPEIRIYTETTISLLQDHPSGALYAAIIEAYDSPSGTVYDITAALEIVNSRQLNRIIEQPTTWTPDYDLDVEWLSAMLESGELSISKDLWTIEAE